MSGRGLRQKGAAANNGSNGRAHAVCVGPEVKGMRAGLFLGRVIPAAKDA
jgi:hypothetical protein